MQRPQKVPFVLKCLIQRLVSKCEEKNHKSTFQSFITTSSCYFRRTFRRNSAKTEFSNAVDDTGESITAISQNNNLATTVVRKWSIWQKRQNKDEKTDTKLSSLTHTPPGGKKQQVWLNAKIQIWLRKNNLQAQKKNTQTKQIIQKAPFDASAVTMTYCRYLRYISISTLGSQLSS